MFDNEHKHKEFLNSIGMLSIHCVIRVVEVLGASEAKRGYCG